MTKHGTDQAHWYQTNFELFEKNLNGEASSRVHAMRKEALVRFAQTGFPTTKHEEWRFTNVAPIAKVSFQPSFEAGVVGLSREDVVRLSFGTAHQLVFVNGHFVEHLSSVGTLPRGAIVGSLASALKGNDELAHGFIGKYASIQENPFTALNMAFVQDGAFLYIPQGTVLEEAISLLFISTGTAPLYVAPRNLIIVGDRAEVTIAESYFSLATSGTLTNVVTEIVAGEGAIIEHDKLQNECAEAYHVASLHVHQKGKSNFISNSIALGGALVRNNVSSVLDGEYAECTLNGLSVANGTQLIDNHTVIDHAKPNCPSHELYKSVLDDASRGVFNGKIFVRRDAQKTDAKQTNKTLLLSDDATMDTKPQLEIFADDVKCTHGATVGQLDAEQMFYLRSRGIDETLAADILTFAFAGDVVRRVHVDGLREQLETLVHAKLGKGRER